MNLLLLLSCTAAPGDSGSAPLQVEWELSQAVPTVPTLRFEADDVDAAWVVFGQGDAWDGRVAVDLSGEPPWATPILGLYPTTDYRFRIEAETAGGPRQSEALSITTGEALNTLPPFEATTHDAARATGGWLVTSIIAQQTAVIMDTEGRLVWWHSLPEVSMLGRVRLSRDGRSVLMASINLEAAEEVDLVRVSLDGQDEERISTPWRHHDFVEHEDGTLAWLAHDPREVDGETVHGDRVVELSPDGEYREVYTVWDHHEPELSGGPGGGGLSDFPAVGTSDWPHANALDWLPQENAYLVSFLHLGGIAMIDRDTGQERWFLGGPDSTMLEDGQADWFDGQHGMDLDGDSLLVFVNGYGDSASRVVELQLSPETGAAEQVWSWSPDPSQFSPTLGDVHRHASGNVLGIWSYNGLLVEVSPQGELLWSLAASLGGAMSYLGWTDRLQAE